MKSENRMNIKEFHLELDENTQKQIVFILLAGAIYNMAIAMFMLVPFLSLNYAIEGMVR